MPDTMRTPVFHILLALAREDLHGLGIAQSIDSTTDGSVQLGPGTLYRSLKEMVRDGLITEVSPPSPGEDPRRRYYRITAQGQDAVRAEASRLERVVQVARDAAVLPQAR